MKAQVQVVLAVLEREGRYFLQRRDPAATHLPGRWEFPGGKVGAGEAPEAALHRELEEEIAWKPTSLEMRFEVPFDYPERRVTLKVYRCAGPGEPLTALAWGWFTLSEMRSLPLPEANLDWLHRLDLP